VLEALRRNLGAAALRDLSFADHPDFALAKRADWTGLVKSIGQCLA
jgi:hypothetical protein